MNPTHPTYSVKNIFGSHFAEKLSETMLSKYITLFLLITIQLLCYKVGDINSDGGCYYVSDKAEDWFDALTICQLLGRCLASVSTAKMFTSLTKHLTKNSNLSNVEFWTGINAYEKHVFAYVEDSTLVKYIPPGITLDPEDSCVYVKSQGAENATMKSDLCCTKRRFICADATTCNKRKMQVHHTLVLEREIERPNDICLSLTKRTKTKRTGNGRIKNRSDNETISDERKKTNENFWNKFLHFIASEDGALNFSFKKSWHIE